MFGRRKPTTPAYGPSVPQPYADLIPQSAQVPLLVRLARTSRLPEAARHLLITLDTEITQAEQYATRSTAADPLVGHSLATIRDTEVPDVVSAYLSLPPGTVLPDGHTADDTLVAQLSTLLNAVRQQMSRITDDGRTDMQIESAYLADKYRDG